MNGYALIRFGCTECAGSWTGTQGGDQPVVNAYGRFDTIDEAKADKRSGGTRQQWVEHPMGGQVWQESDGGAWIAPLAVLAAAP